MALRQQVESRRGGENVTPPGIWGSHHMTHDHIQIPHFTFYFHFVATLIKQNWCKEN